MKLKRNRLNLLITLFAAVLFVPLLGNVHLFDWDEINFAECAREMLLTENYLGLQMNFQPFWEKPPLFIWLQALSMKVFGVNEFAARLPNAVCGNITLLLIFNIGRIHFNKKIGLLWVLCYAGSILPQFYFRSGIIDPWFNLFIFCSLYFFILSSFYMKADARLGILFLCISALFIGLAVLTKGPVAIIIYLLCIGVFVVKQKFKTGFRLGPVLLAVFIVFLSGGLWFLFLVLNGKEKIIWQFISYQAHLFRTEDSGHGGPFYYHFVILLLGCFPASIFAMRAMGKNGSENLFHRHFKFGMLVLFWVVLILFSVVQTKIVHYSSLCYFPLTFLAAYGIHQILEGRLLWKSWMNVLLVVTGGTFSLLLFLLPFVERYKDKLISTGIIADEFTKGNLQAEVHWKGYESFVGLAMFLLLGAGIYLARKKMFLKSVTVLFGGTMVVTTLASLIIIPRVEQYSQGAAIDFFKSHANGNSYVAALGYHSYAQYFYSDRKPEENPEKLSISWMLHGPIDQDAYFISKISNAADHQKDNPQITEIGRKNGYVFFKRQSAQK